MISNLEGGVVNVCLSFSFFYGWLEFNALFEWMVLIYVIVELISVFQSDWQRARLLTNENCCRSHSTTRNRNGLIDKWVRYSICSHCYSHRLYDKSQNKCLSYLLFEATEPAQCQLNVCYTFGLMGCDMVFRYNSSER